MRHILEKALSIGLGVLIMSIMISIAVVLFGGSAIGFLGLIFGIPIAFPMTTSLLIVVFLLVFLRKRK